MQRIEYPKGSKVTIEDGVILIEPAKWEPKVGEIVKVFRGDDSFVLFYTEKRSNRATTGFNSAGGPVIKGMALYNMDVVSSASQEEKNGLLTALANAGYRYNEETHEVEKIRWKPEIGCSYWTFGATRVFQDANNNCTLDKERINNSLAFKTQQEAQEFFDQVKELAKKR